MHTRSECQRDHQRAYPGVCRDPDDEPYLHTARAGRADYIVSGDGDLLDMKHVEGIPIVAPADFVRTVLRGKP